MSSTAAIGVEERDDGPNLRYGFNAHEWAVLLPLSLVGFFLNYDVGLLSIAAPTIADGLDVTVERFGIGVAIIRVAALAAIPILRYADRIGRRRMLLASVLAFTAATAATSLAWGLVSFVVFQMVARLFLATEESLAGIVISEELRPDRRGGGLTLLGIIAMSGFGLVAIMLLVVPLTPLDWRILYVAALPPLLMVVWLRRNLRETRAFTVAQGKDRVQASLWPRVDRVHRPRLWRITVVLGLQGMLATPMFFYAAELALDGYDWEGVYTVIVIAAGPATLLGYVAGGTAQRPGRAQAGALRRDRGHGHRRGARVLRAARLVRPRVLRDDRRGGRDRGRSPRLHLRAVPDRGASHVAGLHLRGGRRRRVRRPGVRGRARRGLDDARLDRRPRRWRRSPGSRRSAGLPETAGSDVIEV